uniref:Uncharacterized protein n=1 Tax=Arundo donax TaxID=35708 RepID=A0A0A9C9T3_ARUDO
MIICSSTGDAAARTDECAATVLPSDVTTRMSAGDGRSAPKSAQNAIFPRSCSPGDIKNLLWARLPVSHCSWYTARFKNTVIYET